jgi:hypothetical protein
MKSHVVSNNSPLRPKTKRFGYEKTSATSPATQDAQAFFLELIPQLRSEVTTTLFDIAYRPFVKFLDAHQNLILSIKQNLEASPFPTDAAIKIVVHGWSALKHREMASLLCDAFSEWGKTWNLTDEWCLNHAVVTIREQHLSCLASGIPHPRFTEEAWRTALFEPQCAAIFTQAEIIQSFRHKDLHEFTFSHEQLNFTVEGPFYRPIVEFKQEVRKEFEARGGRTFRSARKSLLHQLHSYLDAVGDAANELNLKEPPIRRRAAKEHIKWLIDYQLPPCKTYRQIAREVREKEDDKTVREGIQRAASLIGLNLRSSEADKRLGRPKGAKDKNPRHRVDRRREQLRGIAN